MKTKATCCHPEVRFTLLPTRSIMAVCTACNHVLRRAEGPSLGPDDWMLGANGKAIFYRRGIKRKYITRLFRPFMDEEFAEGRMTYICHSGS